MTRINRLFRSAFVAGVLAGPMAGCQDFLDINDNPNAPQTVSANLYLAPMLHWWVTSPQFDGRFVGRYTQQWYLTGTSLSTWDRMGYDPSSDNGGQQWRDVYWTFGQNLVDMMNEAEAEERWDLLGVGNILKAWGWLVLTDLHGEIIVKEAIDQSRFVFNYDTQEYAYSEVLRLLDSATVLLNRTDGAVDPSYLGRTDKIFSGDRTKWRKVAFGLKAIALNHFSNKSSYDPAAVIAAVDQAMASNADDPLLGYPALQANDDRNFLGRTRNNITNYRQTRFVVGLMDGTALGGVVDPRMSRMLSPSPDGQYRGLDINQVGFSGLPAAQQPNNFFGYAGTGGLQQASRYIFSDKSKLPVITYAQLQFVKAEAAYRMGNKAAALAAYTNGISAHIDFVNARNSDDGQAPAQISAAEKAAFLAAPAIVPASASALTLTQIMSQKYIAQWGWGHNEIWMDLRRYHYTDIDPASGIQVFPGFAPPTTLYPDNGGKVAQRIRPRFNSEYVWNRASLDAIGGLATDYHTKTLWIIEP
ncbi:MAG: RagB/SusD family nutrient uptake outer membrane protein [Gemmatimonadales bacterium]